jgi:hypothetical protein
MAAIAGIGRKPDTIEDRAVNITILRALPGEQVEKFRLRRDVPTMHLLRDRIAAWAGEHLTDKPPVLMPVELQDRAEDAWEPLISVGDAAGGDWPKLAREAAIVLDREAADNDGEQSLEVRLLADVQSVFAGTPDVTLLGSKVLLTELRKIDDAPWSELDFTSRKLALRLGKFEVKPRHNSAKTERGYHLEPCTTLSTGTSVQPVRNRPTRRLTCMKALDGSRTVRTAPVRNPSKCPQLVRTKPQVRALMDGSGRFRTVSPAGTVRWAQARSVSSAGVGGSIPVGQHFCTRSARKLIESGRWTHEQPNPSPRLRIAWLHSTTVTGSGCPRSPWPTALQRCADRMPPYLRRPPRKVQS